MAASENLRGMALMTGSMAFFATGDALIKDLSATMAQGHIIWMMGLGGLIVFAIVGLVRNQPPISRDLLDRYVLMRMLSEAVAVIGIVMALSLVPFSTVVAIMQSVPLIVTLGAVLLLKEQVGWRRWLAIFVGFVGVMLLVRPGSTEFSPAVLLAVLGTFGIAGRDLFARMAPKSSTHIQLSTWSFAALFPAGIFLAVLLNQPLLQPTFGQLSAVAAIVAAAGVAVMLVTMAMRMGDVAVVAPMRYTRLIFGLFIAIIWFGERPDALTWLGAAIIVASGLYAYYRERAAALAAG